MILFGEWMQKQEKAKIILENFDENKERVTGIETNRLSHREMINKNLD